MKLETLKSRLLETEENFEKAKAVFQQFAGQKRMLESLIREEEALKELPKEKENG